VDTKSLRIGVTPDHGLTAKRSVTGSDSNRKPFSLWVFRRKWVAVEITPSSEESFSETKLAPDPLRARVLAALRAGAMVATVEVKLTLATWVAGVEVSAHFRRAAMVDGPDGAALHRTHGAG
jgi:hypothetical protein